MTKPVIRPIGTVRNQSTYKVRLLADLAAPEATVVYKSSAGTDTIFCATCHSETCDHAKAIRHTLAPATDPA